MTGVAGGRHVDGQYLGAGVADHSPLSPGSDGSGAQWESDSDDDDDDSDDSGGGSSEDDD